MTDVNNCIKKAKRDAKRLNRKSNNTKNITLRIKNLPDDLDEDIVAYTFLNFIAETCSEADVEIVKKGK